jgi:hypothetical protein
VHSLFPLPPAICKGKVGALGFAERRKVAFLVGPESGRRSYDVANAFLGFTLTLRAVRVGVGVCGM